VILVGVPESQKPALLPVLVGALLVLEALVLFGVGLVALVIGGFTSVLAFGLGSGNATSAQLAQTGALVLLMLASPFVVALALVLGGLFLLVRRGGTWVIAAGVVALLAQLGLHHFMKRPLHWAELLPLSLHVLAIALGYGLVKAHANSNHRS
jgi:hypothetical protein